MYPRRSPRKDWLRCYTRSFNTVEGDSTFYALPSTDTVRRWSEQAEEGFRFCFKFPPLISHQLELEQAAEPTREFLNCLEPLAETGKLGPTFLQLGPRFGPNRSGVLSRYLRGLPSGFAWAIELRHHGWFDSDDHEQRVEALRFVSCDGFRSSCLS